jgi:hypothetical protein
MSKIKNIYDLQLRTLDDVMNLYIEGKDRLVEIYETITGEVLSDNTLVELNSPSQVAIWRLWVFITSFQIWMHEFLWINYKSNLDEAALYAQSHTLAWYRFKALLFQFGDVLTATSGAIIYNIIDPTKQIIKACAVKETTEGILIIKVAKNDVAGELTTLSNIELIDFKGYINHVKDAGVVTKIISQNADVLKIQADVYYNASIAPFNMFQATFEQSVNDYLRNIGFDGELRKLKLVDAMQDVLGFVDIQFQLIEASPAYVTVPTFQAINLTYNAVAGYVKIDPNFPLTTTINYIQYV